MKIKGVNRGLLHRHSFKLGPFTCGRGVKRNANLGSIFDFLNNRIVRKVTTLPSLKTVWSFCSNSTFLSNEDIILFCQKIGVLFQSGMKIF